MKYAAKRGGSPIAAALDTEVLVPAAIDSTVRQARALYYANNNLPPDGGRAASWWAPLRFGRFRMPLYNFAWRRRALPYHDLHHVITGYACSPSGEFQMAAWEFAAGRFRSVYSTLFCLPLVGLGACLCPRQTYRAFLRGRRSASLYSQPITDTLLDLPLAELRRRSLPAAPPSADIRDRLAYLGLVTLSVALMMGPCVLLVLLS